MIPHLTFIGLLASAGPAPVPFQVANGLTIETQFLEQNQRAPQAGFLLSKQAFTALVTEMRSAGPACESRVKDQVDTCQRQLSESAERCQLLLKPLTEKIEALDQLQTKLASDLEVEQSRLARWRIGAYTAGSLLLYTVAHIVITR